MDEVACYFTAGLYAIHPPLSLPPLSSPPLPLSPSLHTYTGNPFGCTAANGVAGAIVQAAAQHLQYADYADLEVEERVAVLRGLAALALDAEPIRDHVAVHVDGSTSLKEPRLTRRPLVR